MRLLLGGVVGALLGFVSFRFLANDFMLAIWTAIVWGIAVSALMESLLTAPQRNQGRGGLIGAMVAIAVGAALIGISPRLPISPELRLALQLLVLGTGFAGCSGAVLLLSRSAPASSPRKKGDTPRTPSDRKKSDSM